MASEKEIPQLLQGLMGPKYPQGVEDIKIVDSEGREWKSGPTADDLWKCSRINIFASKPSKYNARITYNPRVVGARDMLE